MAKAKTAGARPVGRPRREEDVIDRAHRVARGVIRVAAIVKSVEKMPEGAPKERLKGLVDRMVADLKAIPL